MDCLKQIFKTYFGTNLISESESIDFVKSIHFSILSTISNLKNAKYLNPQVAKNVFINLIHLSERIQTRKSIRIIKKILSTFGKNKTEAIMIKKMIYFFIRNLI